MTFISRLDTDPTKIIGLDCEGFGGSFEFICDRCDEVVSWSQPNPELFEKWQSNGDIFRSMVEQIKCQRWRFFREDGLIAASLL